MSRGQGRQGRQRGHRRQGGNGRQRGQGRNLSPNLPPLSTLPTLPISHSPTPYPQKNMQPKWLEWAQKLQAIALVGCWLLIVVQTCHVHWLVVSG
ncbi:hypothetical protein [Fischerella thermalis]|uniref:hypothetical protein n=1 Tax=Fischerella thermalis TaxID=372787 RepID=UPI0011AEC6CA|nr:hypothetical protein [Fischerella thermalis]